MTTTNLQPCRHAPSGEAARANPHPDACGACWACRGDEPPYALMPDPDAPPGSWSRETVSLKAGEALADAALTAHERGEVEDPYALMEVWS